MKTSQLFSSLVLVSAVLTSNSAFADTCDAAWSQAQTLLKQNRLLGAREQYQACLNTCVANTGPELEASKDCSESLKRLEQDIPTIVLSAADAGGKQLTNVSVAIDGRSVTQQLDGAALELDPGSHSFAFTFEGTTKTLEATSNEGQRNQEVKMVFETVGAKPVAPAPVNRGPLQHVAFASEDSEHWELASSDGKLMCVLPCTADLAADQGYQVRSKAGSRKTFLGSAVAGSSAIVSPPRGSKGTAGLTFLVSTVVTGIGVGVYFAGNTQECGYGAHPDENGNTVYYRTVKGDCSDTQPPTGYLAGTGTDLGDTSEGNAKAGIVLGAAGGAGMVVGGIWWLLSDSDPSITWGRQTGSQPAKKVGLLVSPTSWGLQGTW